jgi:hypothetical protein
MRRRHLLLLTTLLCIGAAPSGAWWPEGHSIVAEGAVRTLPAEVPAFFREGHALIAHCAQDPDVAKNRDTPNLRDAEEPEHYVDVELLQGRPFPKTRSEYLKLCAEMKLDPKKVGLLPYSVSEWTERLAVGFAEHRKWPENSSIRAKCLVYAGFLAHYAGDLCMPLHVTVHHNGRAMPDGTSPQTGIHARVDALIEKAGLKPEELAREQTAEAAADLFGFVLKEIAASGALVDRVYALEPKLPSENGPWTAEPEVEAFTRERARASARFLGSLYLTAWKRSESIRLPAWLKR